MCSCCTYWVQDDAAAPSDAESDDGEAERMVNDADYPILLLLTMPGAPIFSVMLRASSEQSTNCFLQNCDWDAHPAEYILAHTLTQKVHTSVCM